MECALTERPVRRQENSLDLQSWQFYLSVRNNLTLINSLIRFQQGVSVQWSQSFPYCQSNGIPRLR